MLRHKNNNGIWKNINDINDRYNEEIYEYNKMQEFEIRYSDCRKRLDSDTISQAQLFMIKVFRKKLTLDNDLDNYIELNISKRKAIFKEYVELVFYKIDNKLISYQNITISKKN